MPKARAVPAGMQDPFALTPDYVATHPGLQPSRMKVFRQRAAGVAIAAFVVLALFGKVWFAVHVYTFNVVDNDHLAGHRGTSGETEVPANGVSILPGNPVSVTYTKQPHEFASVSTEAPIPNWTPAMLGGSMWGLNMWVPYGRDYITLSAVKASKSLDDPVLRKRWLARDNRQEEADAGQYVAPVKTRLAGHAAYAWGYTDTNQSWIYTVRVPDGKNLYIVGCRVIPGPDAAAFKQQCKQVASTLTINKRMVVSGGDQS